MQYFKTFIQILIVWLTLTFTRVTLYLSNYIVLYTRKTVTLSASVSPNLSPLQASFRSVYSFSLAFLPFSLPLSFFAPLFPPPPPHTFFSDPTVHHVTALPSHSRLFPASVFISQPLSGTVQGRAFSHWLTGVWHSGGGMSLAA